MSRGTQPRFNAKETAALSKLLRSQCDCPHLAAALAKLEQATKTAAERRAPPPFLPKEMRRTTPRGWTSFLNRFQCYGTERRKDTLDHLRSSDNFHLGTVWYFDPLNSSRKTYWIFKGAIPPEPAKADK